MKDGRFEIGDKIIANEKANDRYSITRRGWVGKVRYIHENYDLASNSDTIQVKGQGGTFWVNHNCFDLQEKSIKIVGASLPECCGICFAYNQCYGCAFISLDNSEDIWKSRAKNCPMKEV